MLAILYFYLNTCSTLFCEIFLSNVFVYLVAFGKKKKIKTLHTWYCRVVFLVVAVAHLVLRSFRWQGRASRYRTITSSRDVSACSCGPMTATLLLEKQEIELGSTPRSLESFQMSKSLQFKKITV